MKGLVLTDETALMLVREVIDTDGHLTVCNTAEMCDHNERTAVQCIFKVGVQT